MTHITVRGLTETDRNEYLSMAEEFYSSPAVLHTVPRSHFERTFDDLMHGDPYSRALITEADGKAAGYIRLAVTRSQEAGGDVVWIDEVYVRPSARGLGLGTLLISEAVKRFPAARYRLELEPDNTAARRLYERLGFASLGYAQMYKDVNGEK